MRFRFEFAQLFEHHVEMVLNLSLRGFSTARQFITLCCFLHNYSFLLLQFEILSLLYYVNCDCALLVKLDIM